MLKSTEEDWEKLRRLLEYVFGTLYIPRIVGARHLTVLQSWADASYAVYPDMEGHTWV